MKIKSLNSLTLSVCAAVFSAAQMANAVTYTWNVTSGNWNVPGSWTPATSVAGPASADTAVFGATGVSADAVTVNNVVNVNFPIATLTYNQNGASAFHVTQIPAGQKLTVSGAVTVGGLVLDGSITSTYLTGGGTFEADGTAFTVKNTGSASQTEIATLDMSGLTNFIYNSSGGTITVAGSGSDARGGGILNLAGVSNNITAGTITFNTGSGNSSSKQSFIQFGGGTNIVNVGTFNIVATKASNGKVQFISGAPATAGLRLRGVNGNSDDNSRATITLGNRNNTGSGNTEGDLLLNGYPVDIKASTLTIGADTSGSTSATHGGIGVVQFDTGKIDATSIIMAACTTADPGAPSATGTLTVGANGTLVAGTGGISMANRVNGTATGILNISGGTVISSNSIVKANNAGTGTGTITMTGGALKMISGTIGTPAIPMDTLNLSSATLQLAVTNNSTNIVVSALNVLDSANVVNVTALPVLLGYPSQFPIMSYVSGGGDMLVGTLPGSYQGYISNDTSGLVIWLVITNGPSTAKTVEWGGGVNNLWDTTILNWTNAGVAVSYAENDAVIFDDLGQTGNVSLTGTRTPLGFTVMNDVLNYTLSGSGKITGTVGLIKLGAASLTLSETGGDNFSGGISVGGGTVVLNNAGSAISGSVNVGSGATLQIGNSNTNGNLPSGAVVVDGTLIYSRTNNFTIGVAISGAGSLTKNANGILTLSNTNTYTGTTLVSKGTLALNGSGTISNSSLVIVSNATLDVSAFAGQAVQLSTLTVTNSVLALGVTNAQLAVNVAGLNVDGTSSASNVVNITALPAIASYPATIPLVKSAGAINLLNGSFNFKLGTLPAATPAYAGSISESADSTTVQLTLTAGPTGTRPSVNWVGTDNVSANTNWSDRVNWQLPGAPGSVDNLIFDATGVVGDAVTVNNVVDGNFTVASLNYANTTSGQWHVTQIPAGNTLTVATNVTVGSTTVASGLLTSVAMVDAGTFVATGNTFNIGNNGAAGADQGTTLDLSGLSNFVYNASGGTIAVGVGNRSSANFKLAGVSNNITAGNFNANTPSSSSTVSGTITLGAGTNVFNIGTFNVAAQRGSCTVQFPGTGGLRLRGVAGTDASRATMTLGNRQASGSGGTTTGTLLFNGHAVDLKFGTLTIGQASGVTANTGTGDFQFDTGTVDATAINMAVCSVAGAAANGTMTVGANGTLIVGPGGYSLENQTAGTSTANLNINSGVLICSNSIIKSTSAGTATISLNGGTLNMVSGTIGTPAAPIDTLNLTGGNLNISVNGNGTTTNVVATTINASGPTTININSIGNVSSTVQIPLISYTGSDPYSGLVLGTVPAGYTIGNGGLLVDNVANQTIDIIINPPPTLTWRGAVGSTLNSSWDTSTLNWLNGVTPTAYANPDAAVFDDSASNSVVTMAATVAPNGINVNNSVLNYTINGSGKITGAAGLLKQGSGTLTLAGTGGDNFSGGIIISNGTVLLDNAGSSIAGDVNIDAGTLQIGNNDANGNVPSGNITDNGALVFKSTATNTVAGIISGSGTVTQSGGGITVLSGANSYSGTTLISGGTIRATTALPVGSSSVGAVPGAAVTITNGGTLDIGGNITANTLSFTNGADAKQFFIAGTGAGGSGAIVNNGPANQQNAFQRITLTGDATWGGTTRWDMRGNAAVTPILDLGGHTLTKISTNQLSMVSLIVTNSGDIIINGGILSFETTSTFTNGTGTIYVNAGGVLGHFREAAGLFTRPIVLNGGMIRDLNGTPGSTNDSPITLTANSFLDLNVNSTDLLRLNGIISESAGSFGLTKTNIGSFSLAATNTYSGPTVVVQGRLALADNGSIANSRTLSVAAGATLDVGQRVDGTLTLSANQTLSGFGTVTGIVATAGTSTIAPGSATSTGILTVSGNITLNGTNLMKLSPASATNDVLATGGIITYGGKLSLTNISGTLTSASTFKLFSAAPGNYVGAFSVITPAIPAPGLVWNTNTLATDGILRLAASVNPNPTNLTATVSGNTLTLSWPADHTGWTLQVQTNSLNTGLSGNWFNVPGSTLVNTNVVTINPANGTVFYRMVLQ